MKTPPGEKGFPVIGAAGMQTWELRSTEISPTNSSGDRRVQQGKGGPLIMAAAGVQTWELRRAEISPTESPSNMSCTIEKVLADAKSLVERLREHDSAAEALIEQTTVLNKRVEAMKQYQEEIQELNEVARHRPRSTLVLGIQQENRQIRELQQENKELRTSLEEHQSALELIMSKYREQMFRLLMASKKDDPSVITKLKEQHSKELQTHIDKITEMTAIMRKAIEIDEQCGSQEYDRILKLEQENGQLREILEITRESFLNLRKEESVENAPLSSLVNSTDHNLRKS